MWKIRRCVMLAALPAGLFATPALAQDASSAEEQAGSTSNSLQDAQTSGPAEGGQATDEIVVTAQRRAQNLQDVPISITAASQETLAAAAVTQTSELNVIAPSLSLRTAGGAFTPYIRGIGTFSNVVENPVALYIDGVYYPQQREGLRPLNDIEQVAILKGPQGTLFGRNATGGVIQITTRKPSFDFEGSVTASLDNYALLETGVYVTGPLASKVAFSVSANYSEQFDGYGTNLTTGRDNYLLDHLYALRGKLLFEPGSDTSITLVADYMDRKDRNNSFQAYNANFADYSFLGLPLPPKPRNRYDTLENGTAFSYSKGGGVSLTVEHDFGFAEFLSISAYRDLKGGAIFWPYASPLNPFSVDYRGAPSKMYSQEFQLSGENDRLNWLVGAYYFNYTNASLPTTVAFNTPPFSLSGLQKIDNFGEEKAESFAPFGQIDWEFIEGTTLTLGARWTYEKRKADMQTDITRRLGPPVPIRVADVQEETTFKEPSFRVVLSHDFTRDLLGYVSFNTGFKSGGFNIVNASNSAYAPEKLDAYEAGFKYQARDGRVTLNGAVFYYDATDVQVVNYAGGVANISNGAAAELYGLELDMSLELTTEFTLNTSVLLEHTEFIRFQPATVFTPVGNGRYIVNPNGDASGARLPQAPEMTGRIALDWNRELNSGARIHANVSAAYTGDYLIYPGAPDLIQGDYVMLNATLRYNLPNTDLSITLFGKNLLDEAVLAFPIAQEFGHDANYAPPRTFGIAFRFDF